MSHGGTESDFELTTIELLERLDYQLLLRPGGFCCPCLLTLRPEARRP